MRWTLRPAALSSKANGQAFIRVRQVSSVVNAKKIGNEEVPDTDSTARHWCDSTINAPTTVTSNQLNADIFLPCWRGPQALMSISFLDEMQA